MADLFQTTANVGFNSFQNPMNPFNMNPGAWGIDPTYLTPNYAAPYRPQYQGPMGAPPNPNVGFWRSGWDLVSPFGSGGSSFLAYGNSINQEDPYYSALGYRPADSAAWGAQRVVLPALAFWAGMKASEMKVRSNSAAYSSVMNSFRLATGMAPGMAAAKSAQMGLGARMGSSIGQGLARGFAGGLTAAGVGVSSGAAAGFAGGASLIGAAAGSLAVPLLAGEAILRTADTAFFDPWAATRLGERHLRENFQNVMGGNGLYGNSLNGFGMSRKFASSMSSRLTQDSIRDMTFDTFDMSQLTDFAARSGMLDDTQITQIESRMKTIARQIKVVMKVANEPDFKAAMEMLAEMKVAGANQSIAGRVLSQVGGSSAIAGVSAQRMMNTVGAQGQFLYQSNGLTPYLGQTHAASTFAAFSSAYRMGLISDSTMAKFGGREGITQLALSGQLNAAHTPYNQIMMMNQYLHGGSAGGVVGNLAKFGQRAAMDPLAAAGALELYGSEMMSRQLMEKGPGAILDQLRDISQVIPGMQSSGGKLDVEKAFLLMTRQMGLPEMEAKAVLKELYAYSKGGGQAESALYGNMQASVMKGLEQHGLGFGAANRITRPIRTGWKRFKAGGASIAGSIQEFFGGVGDSFESSFNSVKFGSLTASGSVDSYEEFIGGSDFDSAAYKLGTRGYSSKTPRGGRYSPTVQDSPRLVEEINRLAAAGDKLALKVVSPSASQEDKLSALHRLNVTNRLGRTLSSAEMDGFSRDVLARQSIKAERSGAIASAGSIDRGLDKVLGGGQGMLEGIEMLEAARRIAIGEWDEGSASLLRNKYGSGLSDTQLRDRADSIYKKATEEGISHLTAMLTGQSSAKIIKDASSGVYGKEVAAKIRQIRSSDMSEERKREEISRYATYSAAKATGVPFSPVIDPKILSSDVTSTEISNINEPVREMAKQRLRINSLANQGLINFDTQYSSLADTQLSEAASTFGESVEEFKKAVRSMGGSDDAPSTPDWLPEWMGGSPGGRSKTRRSGED